MKSVKIVAISLLLLFIVLVSRYWLFVNKTLKISVFKTLFTKGGLKTLDNSTNILVLGIPGSSYEGPNLSDTMVVINYNFSKNKATLISIPRDIWSDTLKDKINSAYAYGEVVKIGGGLILSKAEIGAIIGLPIQYGIVVDFDNFKKIIDYLGGINVDIERTFVDNKYPIKGKENEDCAGDEEFKCRHETIKFNKGLNKMDGDTALMFIRSRNAIGIEGNDFARMKRQQLIIDSIKTKVLTQTDFFNLNKIKTFYSEVDTLLERDITNQQVAIVIKNIFLNRNFSIVNKSLSSDLFYTPDYSNYDGRYVLISKDNNFEQIHKYILDILN
ncbi:MAG: LCP family protein [bacterium]